MFIIIVAELKNSKHNLYRRKRRPVRMKQTFDHIAHHYNIIIKRMAGSAHKRIRVRQQTIERREERSKRTAAAAVDGEKKIASERFRAQRKRIEGKNVNHIECMQTFAN